MKCNAANKTSGVHLSGKMIVRMTVFGLFRRMPMFVIVRLCRLPRITVVFNFVFTFVFMVKLATRMVVILKSCRKNLKERRVICKRNG